ncbi:MAG: ABC transporter substrate-binding protein [Rhodospirillaceae bacterium]|nr:ABC transporter substrate-binding protein [Rhodospirillaceae bacterium]
MSAVAVRAAANDPPRRIVSMNLCADQYVLLLAPREHIRSISFLAADPNESPLAHLARGLKLNYGNAEEVIAENPDLILTGEFTTGFAKALLRKLGYRVVEIESVRNLEGTRRVLTDMGRLLGAEGAAAALITDMDRRLDAVRAAAKPRAVASAIVYDANGFTVGKPSLADEALSAAGLENLAPSLGIVDFGQLALEDLLMARPQVIVRLDYRPGAASLAAQAIAHPAVKAMMDGRAPLHISGRLLTCAIPTIADAAEALNSQLVAGGS